MCVVEDRNRHFDREIFTLSTPSTCVFEPLAHEYCHGGKLRFLQNYSVARAHVVLYLAYGYVVLTECGYSSFRCDTVLLNTFIKHHNGLPTMCGDGQRQI